MMMYAHGSIDVGLRSYSVALAEGVVPGDQQESLAPVVVPRFQAGSLAAAQMGTSDTVSEFGEGL